MAASTGKRPVYGPSVSDLSNSTDRSMGGGGGGVLGVNYTPSQMMRTVTLGKTAGISGPTVRGDGYKASVGVGPRGSIGIGGKVKFKKGGKVGSASKRADGCCTKGKTKREDGLMAKSPAWTRKEGKKPKGYKDGGDIIVTGQRPQDGATFGGYRLPVSRGTQTMSRSGYGSSGGGSSSRYTPQPSSPASGREGLGLGRTAGISGPTVRGEGYRVSAGVGPRGSIGRGGKVKFKKGGDVKGKGKPVKKAAGGAAKVRKGACSPDGKIINAMRKLRGK